MESSNPDQRIRDALTQLLSQSDVTNTELVLSLKAQLLSAEQRRQIGVLLSNAVPIKVIEDATLAEAPVIEYLKRHHPLPSATAHHAETAETPSSGQEDHSSSLINPPSQLSREEIESIVQDKIYALQEKLIAHTEQEMARRFEQIRNNEPQEGAQRGLQSIQEEIQAIRNRLESELAQQSANLSTQVNQLQQLTSDQILLPRVRTEIDAAQQSAQFNDRVTEQVQRICLKEKFIEITINGSRDFLYPVWWTFPCGSNGKAIGRIMISRYYAWNGDTRPLDPNRPH